MKAAAILRALMAAVNKTEFWTPAFAKAYREAEAFLKASK